MIRILQNCFARQLECHALQKLLQTCFAEAIGMSLCTLVVTNLNFPGNPIFRIVLLKSNWL